MGVVGRTESDAEVVGDDFLWAVVVENHALVVLEAAAVLFGAATVVELLDDELVDIEVFLFFSLPEGEGLGVGSTSRRMSGRAW